METTLFQQYSSAIRKLELSSINAPTDIPKEFQLQKDGELSSYYIPFDYVNPKAKLVIVGITPGMTQWKNAMRAAQQGLVGNLPTDQLLLNVKNTGAFSGSMRPSLIALLECIGLHKWLGIESCEPLFGSQSHLVQTTSILRHPVFIGNENYNGSPSMTRTAILQELMLKYFAKEAAQLPEALFLPLGPKVSEGLTWLAKQGHIDERRILQGLPHPSGANAERIAYFLQRKPRSALSIETDPVKLDQARNHLIAQVAAMPR